MADRYWVGDGGNWSDNTNHWSAASGGAPGASLPTSADNVYFDTSSFTAGSQTVTVDVTANVLDMDWTGVIAGSGLAGSGTLNIYGYLTLSSNMTWTKTGTTSMRAAAGTETITTNGVQIGSSSGTFELNGAGTFQAIDDITFGGTMAFTRTAGTFDPNGQNVSFVGTSHTISGSTTWFDLTRTGTATLTDSVTFAAGTTQTITGTLTLNGNSATNRLEVKSGTYGTAATLNAAAVSASNVDFRDITGAGAASWDLSAITGLSGDEWGNSGMTLTTPATSTSAATGNWNGAVWGAGRVPLPQDSVIISSGHNITANVYRLGRDITMSAGSTVTFSATINHIIFGGLVIESGAAKAGTSIVINFAGRGSHTLDIDTGFVNTNIDWEFSGIGGTYTIVNLPTISGGMFLLNGTLALGGNSLTMPYISSGGSNFTRTLDLTDSTLTLTSTSGSYPLPSPLTNLTYVTTNSTIIFSNSGTGARTFAGGGNTFNNVTVGGAGVWPLTITGSNTFTGIFKVDATDSAKTVKFTDGTTTTVADFQRDTGGTNIVTLTGTSTAGWNIVKSGAGIVSLDYMNISYSQAS